jgi:hypothetical protein
MSSIEERLVRDIAAVTGGVVVTDTNLQEARDGVFERIERHRRRDRLRTVGVAAAAAVVLAAVGATAFLVLRGDDKAVQPAGGGPTPSDPAADHLTGSAPTPQRLDGVWRVDNGSTIVKFDAGGTVRFDNHGTLYSQPSTIGTYAIDGDVVTVTVTSDARAECVGTRYAMRASLPEPGALHFVPTEPSAACSPVPPIARGVLEQVLPPSHAVTGLVFSQDPDWQPLSDKSLLWGVWTAERGGHVLEMDPGGAYYVADRTGEPIDRGTWSFRSSDLTLTSAAGSATCRAGDTLVLGGVQHEDPGTDAIKGTVKQNTCHASWTPAAWILIPNAGP